MCIKTLPIIAFLCANAQWVPVFAAEILTLSTGEYEPFTGAQLPDGGPLTEMVRLAFSEAGYPVKIDFLPWKRGYTGALDGAYDGTFPYGRNAEREQDFLFSEPFYTLERRMFYRAGSGIDPDDLSTLVGKTYCSPIGHTVYKEFSGLLERRYLTLQTAPNHTSCAKMAEVGRVDFFVTTLDAGTIAVTKADLKRPLLNKPFGKSENHLLVAKTHPRAAKIIAAFNKSVATLKARGTWAKILAKHKL